MSAWWWIEPDVDRATDEVAFLQHRREWDNRLRRGEGACLALVAPAGLIGEVQLWHLSLGGLTCELGVWAAPRSQVGGSGWVGCLGHLYDRLFFDVGIQRIEAPGAVGNDMPRRMFQLMGYEVEARLERWRQLRGELIDYDLFALTPTRWQAARPRVMASIGVWAPQA